MYLLAQDTLNGAEGKITVTVMAASQRSAA